ncbi:MAG: hypothetical protein AB1567_11995 [bacterium]
MKKLTIILTVGCVMVLTMLNQQVEARINLLTTAELTGHGTYRLLSGTMLYDKEDGKYKLWSVTQPAAPYGYWSMYYSESVDLIHWVNINLQEILYGQSDYWNCETPRIVSVLKEPGSGYKMWYNIYWCVTHGPWENWIHYRSSTNGINWSSEQTVLDPSDTYYSDDFNPNAVHLMNGDERLYYTHEYGDSPDHTLRRIDLKDDGVTWFNMTTIKTIYDRGFQNVASTIIGNQNGDSHHRVWVIESGPVLYRYDSVDEGQTWSETCCGIYTGDSIVGSFFDKQNNKEYFIKTDGDTLYLEESLAPTLSIDIILNSNTFGPGETLNADARVTNGDAPVKVDIKAWLSATVGNKEILKSLLNVNNKTLPPNLDKTVNIFDYTFNLPKPVTGEICGRILDTVTGDHLAEDCEPFTYTP